MRLIDADALKEELRNSWIRKAKMPMEADPFLAFAMSDIDNAPTIDICKDCDCRRVAIGALKAEPKTGAWIPCDERLPEHRFYVLVTYKYEYGLIDNGITWYSKTENKWNTSREVIAWMPLPKPYREDGE